MNIADKITRRVCIVFIVVIILEIFNNKEVDEFIRYLFMNVLARIIDIVTADSGFKIAITGFIAYLSRHYIKKIMKYFDNKEK